MKIALFFALGCLLAPLSPLSMDEAQAQPVATTAVTKASIAEGNCPIRDPKAFYKFYYPRKIDRKKAANSEEWTETSQDVNGDGTPELFLANRSGCKSAGGCTTVIYQLQKSECFRTLGALEGEYTITSRAKNGYAEIESIQADPKKQESYFFDPSSSEYEKKSTAREN